MEGTIGEIRGFAGNFAPKSWAFCQGQLLPISGNEALYSIIGVTYGGNGSTTMGLPDLRGRVPISAGQGPGLSSYELGQKSGLETTILNITQMPNHSHMAGGSIKASSATGTASDPNGGYPANGTVEISRGVNAAVKAYGTTANENMASDSLNIMVSSTGGSQPFNNLQPYLAINWIICLEGEYPMRA